MKRSTGTTLIELMIAMTLGSLLLIGALRVFTGARASYRSAESLARLHENLRFAQGIVKADVQLAGFPARPGSAFPHPVSPVRCGGRDVTAWAMDVSRPVEVHKAGSKWPCPATDPGGASDLLVVRYARPPTGPADDPGAAQDFVVNAYYIGARSKFDSDRPALRRRSLVRGVMHDEEIIAGIEELKIRLGNNVVTLELGARSDLFEPGYGYRRATVTQTIFLRNLASKRTAEHAGPPL
jgi:hypothetical protein